MGMTATFYFLYNDKFSDGEIKKFTKSLSQKFNRTFKISFKESKKWLPVHIDGYEEGCGYINDAIMKELSWKFNTPVIASTVFDSDCFILELCEDGDIVERYYFGEEDLAEEYGAERENLEVPIKLCKYGIEKECLKTIWNNYNYVFAENVLEKLICAMGGFWE